MVDQLGNCTHVTARVGYWIDHSRSSLSIVRYLRVADGNQASAPGRPGLDVGKWDARG